MIVGLDSSASVPTAAMAQAARAAGINLWSGYISSRPNVGLYHAWSRADFDNARLCGGTPIGFASGWDDPVAVKNLAATWNVRLCLDVESGIRGDGGWVQPWLDASGAGLYGTLNVHTNRRAPFHVLAWYLADPRATWANYGRPATPCGWQWQNTHNEFGASVDRGYYDDWFLNSNPNVTAGSEVRVPQEDQLTDAELVTMHHLMQWVCFGQIDGSQQKAFLDAVHGGQGMNSIFDGWYASPQAAAWRAKLDSVGLQGPAGPPGPPGPTSAVDVSKFSTKGHSHVVEPDV